MFPIIEGISDPSRKFVGVLHRILRTCNSIFIKITASSSVCRQTLLKMLLPISLAGSIFLSYQTCPKKLEVSNAIFLIFHIVIISVPAWTRSSSSGASTCGFWERSDGNLFEFPVWYLPSSSYPNLMALIIAVGERMEVTVCAIISRRFVKPRLLRWII